MQRISKTRKFAVGLLAALGASSGARSAMATGEEWHMMFNCQADLEPNVIHWGLDSHGYYNADGNYVRTLICQQPHFFGNSGIASASAEVFAGNSYDGVEVSLCMADDEGGGPTTTCWNISTPAGATGDFTLAWPPIVWVGYESYYWSVYLPTIDSIYGTMSYLHTMKLVDN